MTQEVLKADEKLSSSLSLRKRQILDNNQPTACIVKERSPTITHPPSGWSTDNWYLPTVLKAPVYFWTQSDDPISCYGKPVERATEVAQ